MVMNNKLKSKELKYSNVEVRFFKLLFAKIEVDDHLKDLEMK